MRAPRRRRTFLILAVVVVLVGTAVAVETGRIDLSTGLRWILTQDWFWLIIVPAGLVVLTIAFESLAKDRLEISDWLIGTQLCFAAWGESMGFLVENRGDPASGMVFAVLSLLLIGLLVGHSLFLRFAHMPDKEKVPWSVGIGTFALVLTYLFWKG